MPKKKILKRYRQKPKGSGRRLYTDENPKDTVRIKYASLADARATVAKVKKINKPYARKIQILTVGEQRSKYGGKPKQAAIFKKGKEAIRKQYGKKKDPKLVRAGVSGYNKPKRTPNHPKISCGCCKSWR
ncbi:MAG: hypothetical protein CM15mV51_1460 [uncultured marine virus]|nr:MAG: hypothetical protein CM15mV51_1460 [uncultured marine virus]